MATQGVIVRDLSAVESLGRVSVICTDKTGTLTRNEMMVNYLWDGEQLYFITGSGYIPSGEIYFIDGNPNIVDKSSLQTMNVAAHYRLSLIITIGGLNNNAELVAENDDDGQIQWQAMGDPTEGALLALLRKTSISEESLKSTYHMVQDYPFDPKLKRMTRVFTHPVEGYIAFVKGAIDVLLPLCAYIGDDSSSEKLTSKHAQEILEYANKFAAKGYRVLSFAVRRLSELPQEIDESARDQIEQNLTYIGFVCMIDPLREGIGEVVKESANAGIKTVMITGDALATAHTIGKQLGIVNEDSLVIEGKDVNNVSNDKFERVSVFARVDPDDKQLIVQRYQDIGRSVAVTGDGVNDALALSTSNVGIAMGITGTDVAKEAAHMIITDDSYTSIVKGVREGRGLFNKIRMMVLFYIAINLAEAIIFFGAFILQTGILFLTDAQYILLAITSHTWPGLALVFDRTAKDVMQEKPRDTEEIITQHLAIYLVINSILIAIGVATVYYFTWATALPGNLCFVPFSNLSLQKARIMSITVLLLTECLMILSIRRINQFLPRSIRHESFWFIYLFISISFIGHLLLMYHPLAAPVTLYLGFNFEYIPLKLIDWLVAITLALPSIIGMEIFKWIYRRRDLTF
jgi:Ca2+-transporting ATPase